MTPALMVSDGSDAVFFVYSLLPVAMLLNKTQTSSVSVSD